MKGQHHRNELACSTASSLFTGSLHPQTPNLGPPCTDNKKYHRKVLLHSFQQSGRNGRQTVNRSCSTTNRAKGKYSSTTFIGTVKLYTQKLALLTSANSTLEVFFNCIKLNTIFCHSHDSKLWWPSLLTAQIVLLVLCTVFCPSSTQQNASA